MFKIPDLPDSSSFTLYDDSLSDPESGWETISGSDSSTKLNLTDNTRDYTDKERLDLALKSYYLKLDAYETGKVGFPPLSLSDF